MSVLFSLCVLYIKSAGAKKAFVSAKLTRIFMELETLAYWVQLLQKCLPQMNTLWVGAFIKFSLFHMEYLLVNKTIYMSAKSIKIFMKL